MAIDSRVVKEIIIEKLPHIRKVADLAQLLVVSPDVLKKDFVQQEGLSLSKFVFSVRIEQAMKLLLDSDMECKTICQSVGFSRQDVAARAFKNHTGITMEQYRRTAREQSKK
jgi:AraC-like DNA-binding protein